MKAVNVVFIKNIFLVGSMLFCSSSVCMNTNMEIDIVVSNVKAERKLTTVQCDDSGFGQCVMMKTLLCKKEQTESMCVYYKEQVWDQYQESLDAVQRFYDINSSLWNDLNKAALNLQNASRVRQSNGLGCLVHEVFSKLYERLSSFLLEKNISPQRFKVLTSKSNKYDVTVPQIPYGYNFNGRRFTFNFSQERDLPGEIVVPVNASDQVLRHIVSIISNDLGRIDGLLQLTEKVFNRKGKIALSSSYVWKKLMVMKSLVSIVDAATQDFETALYLQMMVNNSKRFSEDDESLLCNIVVALKNAQQKT